MTKRHQIVWHTGLTGRYGSYVQVNQALQVSRSHLEQWAINECVSLPIASPSAPHSQQVTKRHQIVWHTGLTGRYGSYVQVNQALQVSRSHLEQWAINECVSLPIASPSAPHSQQVTKRHQIVWHTGLTGRYGSYVQVNQALQVSRSHLEQWAINECVSLPIASPSAPHSQQVTKRHQIVWHTGLTGRYGSYVQVNQALQVSRSHLEQWAINECVSLPIASPSAPHSQQVTKRHQIVWHTGLTGRYGSYVQVNQALQVSRSHLEQWAINECVSLPIASPSAPHSQQVTKRHQIVWHTGLTGRYGSYVQVNQALQVSRSHLEQWAINECVSLPIASPSAPHSQQVTKRHQIVWHTGLTGRYGSYVQVNQALQVSRSHLEQWAINECVSLPI